MALTNKQRVALAMNKAAFARYLRGLPPDAVTGAPGSPGSCPIALYLRRSKGIDVYVYSHVIEIDSQVVTGVTRDLADTVPLPTWARKFVAAMDTGVRSWSAGRALGILGGCDGD
jgi:hypothetical protein